MNQPKPHASWIGHTISGRYKIESLLGQGGMSAVYKATDPNLRRAVAVKLIHPHLSSDDEFVRRFEQEAAAVAQLRHQNIIQVYDFNHDSNVYYMVLEFIPGQTLQDKLKALNKSGDLLPLEETINIMAKVCDAVAYAHDKKMIHRDLKPANVMLNPNGQPILMDFGVAKMMGTAQHTATGAIIGTAKYMSPEQAQGDRPDERTDIYSLGVMLYEMAAGVPPFEGESTVAILMKHVSQQPPNIRNIKVDIPDDMANIIEKALAKNRGERHQTASDLAAALRAVDPSAKPSAPAAIPVVAPAAAPEADPDATIMQSAAMSGTAVAPPAPPPSPVPSPVPASVPASVPAKQGGMPMWMIGAAAVVVILLLGIIAIFAFSGGGDGSAEDEAIPAPATEESVAAVVEDEPTFTPAPPVPTEEIIKEDPTSTPKPEPTDTPVPPASKEEAIPTEEPVVEEPTNTPEPEPTIPPTAEPTEEPPPEPPSPEPPAPQDPEPQEQAPLPAGMVSVPAGSFTMGSNSGQPDEQPAHPVLMGGFFIDKFEVTNNEYRRCVADGACTPANSVFSFTRANYRDDPQFGNFPVVSVTWDQAQAYCRFDNKRLPTEAEWEYAARGSDNLTFPWGNSFDPNLSAAGSGDTQPVGSFPGASSPFDALDMAGNAAEWVSDVYDANFYATSPPLNPENSSGGGNDENKDDDEAAARIFRGGSFANPDGAFYTTSRRYTNSQNFSEVDVGFRCASDGPASLPSKKLVEEFCQLFNSIKPGAPCP